MHIGAVNKKRLVIRLILFFLLVVLSFVLFYFGKEHEILFDNKTVDIDGKSYQAVKYVRVTVNGDEKGSLELTAEDRDMVVDEDTEKVIKTEERVFNFGKTSSLMISVPAVAEKAAEVYLPLPGNESESPLPDPAEQEVETATEPDVKTVSPDLSE
jgi:hypothetical protein